MCIRDSSIPGYRVRECVLTHTHTHTHTQEQLTHLNDILFFHNFDFTFMYITVGHELNLFSGPYKYETSNCLT